MNKKFNDEINSLFEKLLKSKEEKLQHIEEIKKKITKKLDFKIKKLYAKKDLIREMWTKKEKLKLQKIGVFRKFIRNSFLVNLRFIFSMPFIYVMIVPALFLHIMLEMYHQICFRLYGIPRVIASEYFIFDRRLLPYLNWFEKFNCFYCSYFNCLLAYAREVAGRTERYWCPIKHSKLMKDPHSNYEDFVDYSDGKALREKWNELRKY